MQEQFLHRCGRVPGEQGDALRRCGLASLEEQMEEVLEKAKGITES